MFNKRGQGLSVNAIIMIVLGVVVLAVLILGFTMGGKNIAPWIGGGDNVDTIVKACSVACGTQSQYDYCTIQRDLKDAEKVEKTDNCNNFATNIEYKKYGIKKCPNLCPTPTEKKDCTAYTEGVTPDSIRTAVEKTEDCENTEDDVTAKVKTLATGTKCCIAKATQ